VERGSALVARAGETMDEIVQAVRRVTDIMGEISAASDEQSQGIEQVSRAVGQMDEVTQQNAALVEEAAAAAASLEEQTSKLKDVIGQWQVGGAGVQAGAPARTELRPEPRKEPTVALEKRENATKVSVRPNVAAKRAVNKLISAPQAPAKVARTVQPAVEAAAAAPGEWETF
jgi:methyl-accepting chemotaxis protein-1 (serine sensor receptor)